MKRFLLLLVMVAPLLMGAAERHPAPYNSALDTAHQTEVLWTYYHAAVDHGAPNECIGAPDSNYMSARGCGTGWQTEYHLPFDAHVSHTRVAVTSTTGANELCTFAFVNWTGSYDSITGAEDMPMGEGTAMDDVAWFDQNIDLTQSERVGVRVRDCTDLYDTGSPVQTSGSPDELCDNDDTTAQCASGGLGADVTRNFHLTVYGYWK
jgi:hypothetical protein